jgi:hypothetical protein
MTSTLRRDKGERHRREGSNVTMKSMIEVMQPQVKKFQQSPKDRRGNRFSWEPPEEV